MAQLPEKWAVAKAREKMLPLLFAEKSIQRLIADEELACYKKSQKNKKKNEDDYPKSTRRLGRKPSPWQAKLPVTPEQHFQELVLKKASAWAKFQECGSDAPIMGSKARERLEPLLRKSPRPAPQFVIRRYIAFLYLFSSPWQSPRIGVALLHVLRRYTDDELDVVLQHLTCKEEETEEGKLCDLTSMKKKLVGKLKERFPTGLIRCTLQDSWMEVVGHLADEPQARLAEEACQEFCMWGTDHVMREIPKAAWTEFELSRNLEELSRNLEKDLENADVKRAAQLRAHAFGCPTCVGGIIRMALSRNQSRGVENHYWIPEVGGENVGGFKDSEVGGGHGGQSISTRTRSDGSGRKLTVTVDWRIVTHVNLETTEPISFEVTPDATVIEVLDEKCRKRVAAYLVKQLEGGVTYTTRLPAWDTLVAEVEETGEGGLRIRMFRRERVLERLREALFLKVRKPVWIALAAAALVVGILYVARARRAEPPPIEVAQGPKPTPSPQTNNAGTLDVVDGGRSRTVLVVNGRGEVPGLPPGISAIAARIVLEGRIPVPDQISGLTTRGQPLGSSGERPVFELQRPVATAVREERPTLCWTPVAGALFHVTIYDERLRTVAQGKGIAGTQWTPTRPLPRGHAYGWQVVATRRSDGIEIAKAPLPTHPARFFVLSAEQEARLLTLERTFQGSPLALGALYVANGLMEDARGELRAFVLENPELASAPGLRGELGLPKEGGRQ